MNRIDVMRIDDKGKSVFKDSIIEEVPFTINLNGKELLTMLTSPDDLKELGIGFLYSSGLIKTVSDIKDVVIDKTNWAADITLNKELAPEDFLFKRLYTSGCGKSVIFHNTMDFINMRKLQSDITIPAAKISDLINRFQTMSVAFKETGCAHSAAMSDSDCIHIFKEDIGRHNAVDKAIGGALMNGLSIKDLILLTSGRISSEIVSKVIRIGVAFIVSRSAPTDQAVKLANDMGLTLIGFARGKRMNVYANSERLI